VERVVNREGEREGREGVGRDGKGGGGRGHGVGKGEGGLDLGICPGPPCS